MTLPHDAKDAGHLITTGMRWLEQDVLSVGFIAVLLVLLLLVLFLVWVLRPSSIRPLEDAAVPVEPIFPRLASTAFQTAGEERPAQPAVDPAAFATLSAEFTEMKDWMSRLTTALQAAQGRIEELDAEVMVLQDQIHDLRAAASRAPQHPMPSMPLATAQAPDRFAGTASADDRFDDERFDGEHSDDERLPSAIALATGGMSIEELMRTCGLSYSEAQLVVLVHGRAAAP